MKSTTSLDTSSAGATLEPTALNGGDITQQSIANLAYALWLNRGCPTGTSDQDWLEAEQQLRAIPEKSVASAGGM